MIATALLLLAVACLLVAHAARASRQALLLPAGATRGRFGLLLALGVGYAVDVVLPFRLGELLRAAVLSRRERIAFTQSAALVAAERLGDLAVVAAILALADPAARLAPVAFAATAALGIAVALAIPASRALRHALWLATAPLARPLRLGIADFAWRLGEIVGSGAMLRARYLERTALMWTLYLLSYALLARATGCAPADAIAILLASPLRPAVDTILAHGGDVATAMLAYVTLPLGAILAYGVLRHRATLARLLRARPATAGAARGARDRFVQTADYEAFLLALFAEPAPLLAGLGVRALGDARLHRLLPGGSDALTALVEVDGGLAVRKFATGAAGDKLAAQSAWLRAAPALPRAEIARERRGKGYHLYDMPLPAGAIGFPEFVHTAPLTESLVILDAVIERIDAVHRASVRPAAPEAIAAYGAEKVAANARAILAFARTHLPARYSINGRALDLSAWDPLLDPAWTGAQIARHDAADIHGDLTLENIVVTPGANPGWYLIDPNPGNLFDTPLLDWAKLMQSLHLGYEGIAHGPRCALDGGAIRLPRARSEAYAALHSRLEARIAERVGPGALREVRFHELVHYLRLIPYRMRRDAEQGLRFFACASLLLDDYGA